MLPVRARRCVENKPSARRVEKLELQAALVLECAVRACSCMRALCRSGPSSLHPRLAPFRAFAVALCFSSLSCCRLVLFATMAAIDSKAVFQKRVSLLGLADLQGKFSEFGWDRHGAFAFAAPTGPGGALNNDDFMRDVARPLLDLPETQPTHPKIAAVRRLLFESQALAVSDVRSRTERTDDAAPR